MEVHVRTGGAGHIGDRLQLTQVHRVCGFRAVADVDDLAKLAVAAHRDGSQRVVRREDRFTERRRRIRREGRTVSYAIVSKRHAVVDRNFSVSS